MVSRTSSSKLHSHAPLKEPPEKGSATAKAADKALSKHPQAARVFLHKRFGTKALSFTPPNWLQRKLGGHRIDADTRDFFAQLGLDNLLHPDPGVRRAAACLFLGARPGQGEFEVTEGLRLAIKKLANPQDKSFDEYQAQNDPPGIHLGALAFEKAKELSRTTQPTPTPTQEPEPQAMVITPAKKPDLSEIDGLLAGVGPAPFAAATPYKLEEHYKRLTRNHDAHTGPFSDADAVKEFTQQMRQAHDYHEPRAHGQVSDLVRFISSGNTEKLSGNRLMPMNQLGDRKFEGPSGRLEALHHLCFNTSFLRDMKPGQAAFYMGLYNELAQQYENAMREQSA
jgi:hypothetical protein